MNVGQYKAQNPTGVAMSYVRLDAPPAIGPGPDAFTMYWHASSINASYQAWSISQYPGVQEKNSVETWPGGSDNLSDGLAANMGYMRPWDKATDTVPGGDPGGLTSGVVAHTWMLQNPATSDLTARLMVYAAKKDKIYGGGWDGVWSDNVGGTNSSRQYADGTEHVMDFLRQSLPGKYVGGNGPWEYRNSPEYKATQQYGLSTGWLGTDPEGYMKMANANLVEGFWNYPQGSSPNQPDTDVFINWNSRVLAYQDPYGMPRYNALWDAYVANSLPRVRWGLTLAMMAGMYYQAPDGGWYDEFWGGSLNKRGYLGQPTGAAVKLSNGVWRRDFANGIALNNSTGSSQSVNLSGTFRHLTGSQAPTVNNGSSVTSVTLPAQDGLILLK